MPTHEDAMAAYAGESQANRKYQAFSEKAAQDGFPNVARPFWRPLKQKPFTQSAFSRC